jgi:hypothetical protein
MAHPARLIGCALALVASVADLGGRAAAQAVPAPALQLPAGTAIKLMVLREVNSRDAKPGERFKLRVNEAVTMGSDVVIPVGASAWGEVLYVGGTGVAGGKGRLSAKLLYVETPAGPLPISGTQGTEGKANTAGVVIGMLSFGLAGLLTKGGNAHFKAGDILTGFVEPVPAALPAGVTAEVTAER